MNIKDLESFRALAQTMHFRKAADLCGISQPSLSIQIKKLETELGVTLFERSQKQVTLSPEGQELLSRANAILLEVEEFKDCARQLSDPYQGKMTLGAFPTLSPYLFPQIFDELRSSYPEMKFYLVEEKTEVLIRQLCEGALDAAFIALPYENPLLSSDTIFQEDFYLAVSPENDISKKTKISLAELDNQSLLLLTEGHCLREQALQICTNNNISEHYDSRASSLETLRQMVSANIGITLIPHCALKENDGLSYIPFNSPSPHRKIALFWRPQSAKSVICQEISDDLKKMLAP